MTTGQHGRRLLPPPQGRLSVSLGDLRCCGVCASAGCAVTKAQAQAREEALLTSCDQPGGVQGLQLGTAWAEQECLGPALPLCLWPPMCLPSVRGSSGPRTWGGAQGLIWGPLPAALVLPAHGPPSHPWGPLFPCWSMAHSLPRCAPLGPRPRAGCCGWHVTPCRLGASVRAGAPASVWSEAGPLLSSGPVSGLLVKGASPQPLDPWGQAAAITGEGGLAELCFDFPQGEQLEHSQAPPGSTSPCRPRGPGAVGAVGSVPLEAASSRLRIPRPVPGTAGAPTAPLPPPRSESPCRLNEAPGCEHTGAGSARGSSPSSAPPGLSKGGVHSRWPPGMSGCACQHWTPAGAVGRGGLSWTLRDAKLRTPSASCRLPLLGHRCGRPLPGAGDTGTAGPHMQPCGRWGDLDR